MRYDLAQVNRPNEFASGLDRHNQIRNSRMAGVQQWPIENRRLFRAPIFRLDAFAPRLAVRFDQLAVRARVDTAFASQVQFRSILGEISEIKQTEFQPG